MERTDEVGAAAAAEYFMRLFAYVMQTGDLTEWDRVSAQDCGFCANVRAEVDQRTAVGSSIIGGRLTLRSSNVVARDENLGVYTVAVPYEIAPIEEIDASGGVVRAVASEEGTGLLDVLYGAPGWTLLGAGTEPEGE